jgi:peptidylprolyl isomerase
VRSSRIRIAAVALTTLVLAGCSDDQEAVVPEGVPERSFDLEAKPDPTELLPSDRGEPPTELVSEDLVPGEGEEAVAGTTVTVHYVGVNWSDGTEFDASWDRGQPFSFELGAGRVIPGWEQGVEGMRVGGRRTLTIPPDLAYGERGAGGVIGPNETLVFVVDLLDVAG